ncbi:MAG: GAF domain-containing protein [Anaerolineaceae bacterium]|nr:GAF domain-containing protein [Anaerolineaceae bacterium]
MQNITSQSHKTLSVHRQIMTRVTAVVIVVFGLLLVLSLALILNRSNNLSSGLEAELILRENQINQFVSESIREAQQVASSNALQMFADGAYDIRSIQDSEIAPASLRSAQDASLLSFLDVFNDFPGRYLEMRYITQSTYSVWTEITVQGGITQTNTDFQFGAKANDPVIDSVMKSSGDILISSVELSQDVSGTYRPVIWMYAPVFHPENPAVILGVIEIKMRALPLLEIVTGATEGMVSEVASERWLLVNNQGQYLADSANANIFLQSLNPARPIGLADNDPDLVDIWQSDRATPVTTLGSQLVSTRLITEGNSADMPWHLFLVVDQGQLPGSRGLLLALAVAATIAGAGATLWVTNRTLLQRLQPLETASVMAAKLASGNIYDTLPPTKSKNALGQLLEAFEYISVRMQDLTADIEDQGAQTIHTLEMAAQISQRAAALTDVDLLLQEMVNWICSQFGYYHAQVYLLDNVGLQADLHHSHGTIGEQLLRENLIVTVGSDSAVGIVARDGETLALSHLDGSLSITGLPTLLQNTRSELVVPLKSGEVVYGVLDIHSIEGTMDQRNIYALQMLADQAAAALKNARELAQTQKQLEQTQRLNRQYTQQSWQETREKHGLKDIYTYNLREVQEVSYREREENAALSLPISVRGEIIGTIDAAPPEGQPFTEGDAFLLEAVANRVALAIEGARLFNETQSSLNLTQQLYALSSNLTKAVSLEDILRAIIESVVQDASSGQLWLFEEGLDFEESFDDEVNEVGWLELKAIWSKPDSAEFRKKDFLNLRLLMSSSPFLQTLQRDRVKLVNDTEHDARIDSHLKGLLQLLSVRAVAIVPFSTRGIWRGIIMIGFPQPREFPPQESRIYAALIDQGGVTIDNRLLHQEQEQNVDELQRLYAASRNINSAQNDLDLVRAVVTASRDSRTSFILSMLEGLLDQTGWPSAARIVARANGGIVTEDDQVYSLVVPPDSPLREREPQIILREDQSPQFSAIFPLFSANQPIALFSVTSDYMRDLSSQDYEIFRALTGQMSTVIENRRLLERTTHALDETQQLYRASRSIATAQDANVVYQVAAESIAEWVTGLTQISILLAGPNPGLQAPYLDYVFVRILDEKITESHMGIRVSSEATMLPSLFSESREAVYIANIETELAENQRLRLALQQNGAVSLIAASIQSGQKWFGIFICEAAEVNALDERFRPFIQAIADQVGIAIENRQLFEEARLEAQRALALAEVGQLATRIGADFEKSLTEAFERIAEPANYDRWLVMLRNEIAPDLLEDVISRSVSGASQWEGSTLNLVTDEHSLIDAIRFDQPIIINEPGKYLAFLGASPSELKALGKHIVAPVRVGGSIAGAVLVGRDLNSVDMSGHDEQLILTLAAQVAVAAENRRLFFRAENEREYLNSILQTMPTGVVVLDGRTLKPIRSNHQAEILFNEALSPDIPFGDEIYNLFRRDTYTPYPMTELPVIHARETGQPQLASDLVIFRNDERIDLLLNAAPIHDNRGDVTAIVAAFQDITNLRILEVELQNRLHESVTLYEGIKTLSSATNLDEVLDAIIKQMEDLSVVNGYIVLLDSETGNQSLQRTVYPVDVFDLPHEVLKQTALFVENVANSPVLSESAKAELAQKGVHAVSSLPMWTREQLLGWAVLSHDQLPARVGDYQQLLRAIVDNAAVSLDNHLLFRNTQEAFVETISLYEISRMLSRATTPEEVVKAAVQHLRQDHIERILMMEVLSKDLDETSGHVRVAVNWRREDIQDIDILNVTLMPEQFPNWRQLVVPSIVTIDDVNQQPDLAEIEVFGFQSLDISAVAILPLFAANQPLGVIWLISSKPYRYTERDLRMYRSFTEQAALSLGAVRLLEQTERRARQLALSAEVTQAASSILNLDELLPQVVDQIKDTFHYDHVQIFMMDARDQFAELRASTGEAGEKLLKLKHKLEKGSISVIGQVTARGEPVVALDTIDARYQHKPNPHLPLTRSEMALPLITEGHVVGALDVQSNRPNAFTPEDADVLKLLAAQISVAIYNARLFAQSDNRARNLGFLFDVTASAASPDESLVESLENVVFQVRDLLRTHVVAVYLQEEYVDLEGNSFAVLAPIAQSGSDQPLTEMPEIPLDDSRHFVSQAATAARPYVIADIGRESDYLPISSSSHSAAIMPMISGNTLTGILILEDMRFNAYQQETMLLLGALTNNLSSIVQSSRLLERIKEQNDQLLELDKLRSDFLANMSHELRTPLNSIIGFSRVILKGIDGPLTEMQEQDVSTIYNSGQHLLGLINDILDQARIAAGKMDLHVDYFDVKPVAEGVRSIGIGLVKDKPIEMVLNISPSLPRAYGDEFRTRQVLLNLVSNASKFTNEGQIALSVYTEFHKESGMEMVRIDVADTGIGIAHKDLPLLFESFRQVDSSLTRTVGGTGLGLPIAKSLIEMQGGAMLVESDEGLGSTFSILIPTAPVSQEQLEEARQRSAASLNLNTVEDTQNITKPKRTTLSQKTVESLPPKSKPVEELPEPDQTENGNRETLEMARARRKRITGTMAGVMAPKRQILIAEENPVMVDQYRRALQREGYDIFAAASSLEAEAMVSGLHPTMIIIDAGFANGTSWDIIARLKSREDTEDIPILVASLSDDAEQAFTAGAFGFIRRPFTPDQLIKTVSHAEKEGQTERILIIDDRPDSTRLIKQILDAQGRYRVYTAHSGSEGITQVVRRRPDLILLDLRMPEMDGFAVLDELRSHPETASIPIVIITGESLNEDERGRLSDLEVLYKMDISAENHEAFLNEVKLYLTGLNGE